MRGECKGKDSMKNYMFSYSCVHPESLDELNHIIDNQEEMTLDEFASNVNHTSFQSLLEDLGYDGHFDVKDDWHVSYHQSQTENGERVYYFQNSGIEYVFKNE